MKRESGLTLVEMFVTLLLTSIFVLVIGFIVVSANQWWTRACRNVMLQDDMRYAKRRISWLLRNAENKPFTVSGDCLTFNGNEKIMLGKDKEGRDQVLYKNEGTGKEEIILTNINYFKIHDIPNLIAMDYKIVHESLTDNSVVMFQIVTSTTATNGAKSGIITSATKFIVKNRNSGS